ncbi:MAG TPA: hypothetical protein EYP09_08355 [Anaerolineae bacterium]|nr:hypothetical protein [Anaerolineae bacterium]
MTVQNRRAIADIAALVAALPAAERRVFDRIFHISTTVGRLRPPETMHGWIERHFGSVEAVLTQRIVKITNLVTMEASLFNDIRASRPIEAKSDECFAKMVEESRGDPFCDPLDYTPEDVFGRVRGAHCVTASNIAKYDGFHGLVIFDEHDPLRFTAEEVGDYLDTALAWAYKAHQVDGEARYFFFMWNCLWRSGASILHGHAQMSLSRDIHYAKVEHLRRAGLRYRAKYGSNYFRDLCTAHRALGLAFENGGTHILVYLTPIKEKEVLLISEPRPGLTPRPHLDDDFKDSIYRVLRCFIDRLGVCSFNLALYLPPIDGGEAKPEEDWSDFPALVRIVDRGDVANRTADMGAMELYAASVVASDPFRVAEALQSSL